MQKKYDTYRLAIFDRRSYARTGLQSNVTKGQAVPALFIFRNNISPTTLSNVPLLKDISLFCEGSIGVAMLAAT